MGLVLVHVKVRAAPGLFHKGLEFFGRGNRNQFVLVAKEHDGGRNALANVVHGGNFFPSVLDPIVTVALWAIVVDRVEQDEGIGLGGDRGIFTVFFEAGNRPGRRGHVATGRTAARSQSIRVDPKLLGIFSNPAYGRLPVLDAFEGGGALPASYPVVRSHRDHSPRGQVFTVGGKLSGVAAGPTPAEEEDDGRPFVLLGIMAFGVESVEDQPRSACFLVYQVLGSFDGGGNLANLGEARTEQER